MPQYYGLNIGPVLILKKEIIITHILLNKYLRNGSDCYHKHYWN